jgi:hypothetical protein
MKEKKTSGYISGSTRIQGNKLFSKVGELRELKIKELAVIDDFLKAHECYFNRIDSLSNPHYKLTKTLNTGGYERYMMSLKYYHLTEKGDKVRYKNINIGPVESFVKESDAEAKTLDKARESLSEIYRNQELVFKPDNAFLELCSKHHTEINELIEVFRRLLRLS